MAFTDLEPAHGYRAALLAGRRVELAADATGASVALSSADGFADDAPAWAGPNSVLFVRRKVGASGEAVATSLSMPTISIGRRTLITSALGAAAPQVAYYGEGDWCPLYSGTPETQLVSEGLNGRLSRRAGRRGAAVVADGRGLPDLPTQL